MHRRAKLSGSPQLWNKFKTMRNKVTSMLCNSKQLFFNRNVNEMDKKQFWKTMRTDQSIIPTLTLNDSEASSDKDKSSILNMYFSDCFNRLLPPLNDTEVSPEAVMSEVDPSTIEELLCTEEEVLNLLQAITSLNPVVQSSGRMLKATSLSIAAPVTNLFHLSISTGTFPTK